MRNNPIPYEIYKHFKGGLYQILSLAKDSVTKEIMVVYQAMYSPFEVWVRPLSVFMSPVDHVKYPEACQDFRFILQEGIYNQRNAEPVKEAEDFADTYLTPDQEEDFNTYVDHSVMEFLEAETYDQKLNILASMHHKITDDMINTLAASMDVQIDNGDKEDRYLQLRTCLLTLKKYECIRLR